MKLLPPSIRTLTLALLGGMLLLSACSHSTVPKVEIGYGWSIQDSERLAAAEAVKKMQSTARAPKLVVLYTTVGYDLTTLLTEVRTQSAGSIVFGITSCHGVVTRDGVHVGKKGSLALLGIQSDEMTVGLAGRNVKTPELAAAAVNDAVEEALLTSGKRGKEKPSMILLGTTPGLEDRSLEALQHIFGKETPIYGGTAADNAMDGKWAAFANDQIIRSGVSVALVYTRGKIAHAYGCGYTPAKSTPAKPKEGLATATEGRTLLSLENKPAADVYNEWTNDLLKDALLKGGSIVSQTTLAPLARRFKVKGEDVFLSLHPASLDLQTKSLGLFAEVPAGETLFLLQGDVPSLLNESAVTATRALQDANAAPSQIAGGLQVFCAGTMMAIQPQVDQIVPPLNAALGNAPFIGAFTFGEQGPIWGHGSVQGNLMNSMVLFEKN